MVIALPWVRRSRSFAKVRFGFLLILISAALNANENAAAASPCDPLFAGEIAVAPPPTVTKTVHAEGVLVARASVVREDTAETALRYTLADLALKKISERGPGNREFIIGRYYKIVVLWFYARPRILSSQLDGVVKRAVYRGFVNRVLDDGQSQTFVMSESKNGAGPQTAIVVDGETTPYVDASFRGLVKKRYHPIGINVFFEETKPHSPKVRE